MNKWLPNAIVSTVFKFNLWLRADSWLDSGLLLWFDNFKIENASDMGEESMKHLQYYAFYHI